MIPRVFHFVFGLRPQTEPFHLMYYLCLMSCIRVNAPDTVYFHYQNEPWGEWWQRIKPLLTLRKIESHPFVASFDYQDPQVAAFRYAHLADFARLEILLREGGVYADIDTLFLKPLPEACYAHQFVIGRERAIAGAEGSLCNAFIACQADAAFCRLWLDEMEQAFDGSWSNHSTLLPYRLAKAHPDSLTIKPERAFYAVDWQPRSINDLFLRDIALPDDAYSLHLWNHLWADRKRLDFSHFDADMLTVAYVRYASTTYARSARAYLPADVTSARWRFYMQRLKQFFTHPMRSCMVALGYR